MINIFHNNVSPYKLFELKKLFYSKDRHVFESEGMKTLNIIELTLFASDIYLNIKIV